MLELLEMKKVMLLVASLGLLASQASFAADRSGEEVFKAVCTMCHSAGVAGAPKFGDKAAWKARIAQGTPVLYDHALKGIRAMPARGGNPDLTDVEVGRAVAYMANQSGASFPTK
mgnify:CR=1 FL=1